MGWRGGKVKDFESFKYLDEQASFWIEDICKNIYVTKTKTKKTNLNLECIKKPWKPAETTWRANTLWKEMAKRPVTSRGRAQLKWQLKEQIQSHSEVPGNPIRRGEIKTLKDAMCWSSCEAPSLLIGVRTGSQPASAEVQRTEHLPGESWARESKC